MELFDPQFFILTLALVGTVIIIAALLSGLIDRTDVPQVAVFLALGAMLGPAGLGLLDVTLSSPTVQIVTTLSLVLVLFTDAVSLSMPEVRRQAGLAFRVLGPGTLLSAALTAVAASLVLRLPVASAAILGAALASTDPIMLRGLLRRPGLPEPVRLGLRLESGLNDAVLLPIVLVAMQFLGHSGLPGDTEWARIVLDLFLLGPGAGIAVGLLAIAALEMIRRKTGVRRDYESIYSLGVAFAAYAAAEAVHGSGFVAAFAAGITIAALDVELCDCFLEYGQTTAEMTLLFAFVLFGSSLIWSGFTVLSLPMLIFAVVVVLVRPVAFLISLAGTTLTFRSRMLIAWFGPRGLSTLLLVLLPVFSGVGGAQALFSICCLIVLLSIVIHGGSLIFLKRNGAPTRDSELVSQPSVSASVITSDGASCSTGNGYQQPETVSIPEMRAIQQSGAPNLVLDVRADRSFIDSDLSAEGSIRIPPDRAAQRLTELGVPRQTWLFAFCA
ncbi:MAG TPA: cation:proton antiporter [Candidatus Binatia bacterium]